MISLIYLNISPRFLLTSDSQFLFFLILRDIAFEQIFDYITREMRFLTKGLFRFWETLRFGRFRDFRGQDLTLNLRKISTFARATPTRVKIIHPWKSLDKIFKFKNLASFWAKRDKICETKSNNHQWPNKCSKCRERSKSEWTVPSPRAWKFTKCAWFHLKHWFLHQMF